MNVGAKKLNMFTDTRQGLVVQNWWFGVISTTLEVDKLFGTTKEN